MTQLPIEFRDTDTMARCKGEELPDDALYLDEEITMETAVALNRSLYLIDRAIGLNENTHVNKKGYPIDWRGLAMMMKFDQRDIARWSELPNDRANAVITVWRKQDDSPTIKKLLDYLRQLQVYSLLRDANFIEAIVDDVGTHKHREYQRRQDELLAESKRQEAEEKEKKRKEEAAKRAGAEAPQHVPLQVAKPEWFSKGAKNQLVLDDVHGEITHFDAFICYAMEDINFVKKMLNSLEANATGTGNAYNLKLCVDARDFLVGSYKYTLTARIMEERCKRIVLVMSPDFVKTPMCEFQTEYALSLSPGSANKKLLPLMYRTCDPPAGLKHIAGLYYTRDELKEWFWPRLGGSLVADLQWDEEEDHQRPDWDQISVPSESICAVPRSEIMSSPKSRGKQGMKKSSSNSSVSSTGSAGVKIDVVSDIKNSPSGSSISIARASPISKPKRTHKTHGTKEADKIASHEVRVRQDSSSPGNLKGSPPKNGAGYNGNVKDSSKYAQDPLRAQNQSIEESHDDEKNATVMAAETLGSMDVYVKEDSTEREPCEMVDLMKTNGEANDTSLNQKKPDKKSRLPKFLQKKKKEKET